MALVLLAALTAALLPAFAQPASAATAAGFRVVSTQPVLAERLAAPRRTRVLPPVAAPPDRSGWQRSGMASATSARGASSLLDRSAVPTRSTWQVTYDAGFKADPLARAEFQRAVDTWAGLVGSSVPITVDAHFRSLGARVLGSAGPGGYVEQTRDNRYSADENAYPVALGNAMAGRDLVPPSSSTSGFDIVANFPNDNPSIYYGTGPVPADSYDFYSTVLHELAHGLGFTSFFDHAGTTGTWGATQAQPYLLDFDRAVVLGTSGAAEELVSMPNGSTRLGSALTSRALYWRGAKGVAAAGGVRPKLYAPSPYEPGSSIAHLDEDAYPTGTADALMTPSAEPGEQNPDVGDIALGILADTGWSVPVRQGSSTTASPSSTPAPAGPGSRFTPLAPRRVLDTRTGLGTGSTARVGAGASVDLLVAGGSTGVPSGATAVVLNVTGVGADRTTDVRVYPMPVDGAVPTVSSLNLAPGQTRAASVTVPVGHDGRVRLRNAAGSVALLADLSGYYAPDGATAFHPVAPVRLLDTRTQPRRVLGPGASLDLPVTGTAGVPSSASAVVLNVTGVGATSSTDLAVYPTATGAAAPGTSSLNLVPGPPVANLVVVQVGDGGRVRLRNSGGSVAVLADLAGWFDARGTGGALFHPVGPVRLFDTRQETDPAGRRLGPGGRGTYTATSGPAAVPASATALLLTVTGVGASSATDLRVYPRAASGDVPDVSTLNLGPGGTAANAALVGIGEGGDVVFRNSGGTVALVSDLSGWFGP